eukprot:gene16417-19531_t
MSPRMLLKLFCPLVVFALLCFCACTPVAELQQLDSKNGFTLVPAPEKNQRVANFAGGCFWAMQECMRELKGVKKVISGYAGGDVANPTYEMVLGGKSGHAETVQVYYDPKVVSFEQLTEAFFYAHDPTQIDGQGPDLGRDYRSIAFYRSTQEYKTIRKVMDKIDRNGPYSEPVLTELMAYKVFYPAETSHQDYYRKHSWDPYIRRVSVPKVLKMKHFVSYLVDPKYLH